MTVDKRPRVLQMFGMSPTLDAALGQAYDIHNLASEQNPPAWLAEHGDRFEGLVTNARTGVSPEILAALPRLRVISIRGVGLDKIDLGEARRRRIQVGNTPDVLTGCVADLAFGLVIDAARKISAADRYVRSGRWKRQKFGLATRVSGKRLGIVGFGRIGRAIAKRASGFDMEVRCFNRSPVEYAGVIREPTVEALARWADFLVVSIAGGAETRHLISAGVLRELGPAGFLVNVARGSVVDEAALVEALVGGGIAGAGLDVLGDEPNVPEALLTLDNVVLLPHVGSGTRETRQAMEELVLANLEAFFRTGRVITPA
ncbi:MAG: hydroxyacid dehydrogenase [Spirochaetae bacterium HGW-Spirochaetae-7]|jgi:lactate dehydrogenase-like 2-hydroxyacid dehydrogenase|nr:MAG: hydroxyacid dehydrogenase [Spirochaetae bacterium HGW-Spirochaetae-7]